MALELIEIGGPWQVLPAGIHEASMEEVKSLFAFNEDRVRLFDGFIEGVRVLAAAGCKAVYLDGSYATNKEIPGDFDACWEEDGVDLALLDPTLLDFSNGRAAQKAVYGGEFFPASTPADTDGRTFVEFFQVEKWTGKAKGIIKIHVTPDVEPGGTT